MLKPSFCVPASARSVYKLTLFGLSEFGTNVLRFTLFHIFIIGMLAVDLGVFNRKWKEATTR